MLKWSGGFPCLLGANADRMEVDHDHAPEEPTDDDVWPLPAQGKGLDVEP